MSKQNPSLESLLQQFDKAEKLRADTEALKPRLENEINAALASGDVLDEKTALALQTKRGQLDLCPAKLEQIADRLEKLTAEIQAEFNPRYIAFSRAVQDLSRQQKEKWTDGILPKIPKIKKAMAERHIAELYALTDQAAQIEGLVSVIRYPLTQQDFIGAARNLLQAENDFEIVRKREFELLASQS